MKYWFLIFYLLIVAMQGFSQSDSIVTKTGSLVIHPVQHASMVIYANDKTIYVDPVGGGSLYRSFRKPDVILVTDIHGDHMDAKTIDSIRTSSTTIVCPAAVSEQLKQGNGFESKILANGEEVNVAGLTVKAIPMYNLPETADSRHPKGRGNGYVLTASGQRIYISGDTEDIPEMRQLKNIDLAFVCMNLPYTMDIDQAASAVIDFKPKIVYPFHYRGQGGLNDVNAFKDRVNQGDRNIDVRLLNWYPSK